MQMWENNYEWDCLETSILEREDLSFHYRIQIKKCKCKKTMMSAIAWGEYSGKRRSKFPLQDTDKEMQMWENNYECDCLATSILEREDLSFHYRIQIKKCKCW